MHGLPRDVDELLRRYEGAIKGAVACDVWRVWQVAHHLWCRGVLEAFKAPLTLTCEQAIAYLGISTSTWMVTAHRRFEVLPVPLEGSHMQRASRYDFADVERLFQYRDLVFTRTARRGFADPVIPGLEEFIAAESRRIAEELDQGYVFDVPLHLPQTPEQLLAQYDGRVAKITRNRVKYGVSIEDALHDVWLKIIDSNVALKFTRSATKHLPAELCTDDVLDYLGVEWSDWQRMMRTYEGAPTPAKGTASSPDAVYRSEDIRALDESGYFKSQLVRVLPAHCVGQSKFDSYFHQMVGNILKNIFRSLDRHSNREDTFGEGTCIHENRRVRKVDRDSFDGGWEETLASEAVSAETLIDINRRLQLQTQKA